MTTLYLQVIPLEALVSGCCRFSVSSFPPHYTVKISGKHPDIQGITTGMKQHKVLLYADDILPSLLMLARKAMVKWIGNDHHYISMWKSQRL